MKSEVWQIINHVVLPVNSVNRQIYSRYTCDTGTPLSHSVFLLHTESLPGSNYHIRRYLYGGGESD